MAVSDSEQIPQIPLGECCKIVSGSTPRTDNPQYWDGEIPWITPKDLSDSDSTYISRGAKSITAEGYKSCSTNLVPAGSVLFSSRAPIGLTAIAATEVCTNQGFKNLVPNSNVDSKYLYYVMKHIAPFIASKGRGATFKEVSKEQMAKFAIPLPKLPEQRRIATILDKVDAIRRKRCQAIDLMNDFLRSVFLEMFEDSSGNGKSFSYQSLGNLLLKIDSGKSPVCLSEVAEDDQWGVLKLSAVTSNVFKPDENKALPSSEKPNPSYEVKEGDLLFTRKNTYQLVGACALVLKTRSKLLLPDLIFRLVIDPSKQILPSFLWGVLTSSSYRQKIMGLAGGTAGSMPNISKARLETLEVPTPEIGLQRKFDRIVRQTFKTIETLEGTQMCSDNLFNSLSSECFGN